MLKKYEIKNESSGRNMSKELLEDFAKTFFEFCEDLLEQFEADLLLLDRQKENIPSLLLENLFATVHSMKGRCGVFGFEKQVALLHEMENVLKLIEAKTLAPEGRVIDALLEAHDLLEKTVSGVEIEIADRGVFGDAIDKLHQLMPGRTFKP
jgi:two-component system chemotaxis sensor kinase CheA